MASQGFRFVFDIDAYLKDLSDFLIVKMNEFQDSCLVKYSFALEEARSVHKTGAPEWMATLNSVLKEYGETHRAKVTHSKQYNGYGVTCSFGIPRPTDSSAWTRLGYDNKDDAARFYVFAISYGIGSNGRSSMKTPAANLGRNIGAPLRYHVVGESSYAPEFDAPHVVTSKDLVQKQVNNHYKLASPGDLLPDEMNQEGTDFFDDLCKIIKTDLELVAPVWWSTFHMSCRWEKYFVRR